MLGKLLKISVTPSSTAWAVRKLGGGHLVDWGGRRVDKRVDTGA